MGGAIQFGAATGGAHADNARRAVAVPRRGARSAREQSTDDAAGACAPAPAPRPTAHAASESVRDDASSPGYRSGERSCSRSSLRLGAGGRVKVASPTCGAK
jgi:hypothetical protein